MAGLTGFIRNVRRVVGLQKAGDLPDAQLLKDFVSERDEVAFEALVRRHGPMVLGVCRRVLQEEHDAEDAFQATFLVLLRKAHAIGQPELLGNWLFGVAYRIALRARSAAAKRRRLERQAVDMHSARTSHEPAGSELSPMLEAEVNRLPKKYRAPVVLCYLEGKTNEEASRELGWPLGTVAGRLARARDMLRTRLSRRGLAFSAGVFAMALSYQAAPAAVPSPLLAFTVKAAMSIAAGHAAAGAFSASVAALAEGALHTMFLTKLKIAGLVLVAVGLVGAGCLATHQALADKETQSKKVENLGAILADTPKRAEKEKEADQPKKDSDKKSNSASARQRSANNLKPIGIAMHNYHDNFGRFPAHAIYSKDGKPLLSWRVMILPFIEENDLYKQFKLDEPWDSENNKKLLDQMPVIYAPLGGETKDKHSTFYQVFVGKGTIFDPAEKKVTWASITDGSSNTLFAAEAGEAVPWTKPDDLVFDPDKALPALGGMFKGGFHVLMADGSVHFLKEKFDENKMKLLIIRNDGQRVDVNDLKK
jgi:RNA polymerase sigma factor (sigma-70 family)